MSERQRAVGNGRQADSGGGFGMGFRGADAALIINNQVDRLLHVVGDGHQFEVIRVDESVFFERSFYPLNQSIPVLAAEEDQWKTRNAPGLHQGDDFKKLVERPETAG